MAMTCPRQFSAALVGAALLSCSFAYGQPAIEEGQPTLIRSSGSAVLADDLITDNQLRRRLENLQGSLAGEYATQDALTQLLDRLFRMEREIKQLRGDVELLNERLRRAEEQNRERYLDLDQRMTGIQAAEAWVSPALVNEPASARETTDPAEVEAAYREARGLIADREYEAAVEALADFVQKYPESGLGSDALFWQAEVHTLLGEYDNAQRVYEKVVSEFEDAPKRIDALFKLGFVAERQSRPDAAQGYYEQVLSQAPDSSLAELARQRLDRLRGE